MTHPLNEHGVYTKPKSHTLFWIVLISLVFFAICWAIGGRAHAQSELDLKSSDFSVRLQFLSLPLDSRSSDFVVSKASRLRAIDYIHAILSE